MDSQRKEERPMTKNSNSTFEVTPDFLEMTESQQDTSVKAFLAANPSAVTKPIEDGAIPPYLRRQAGKRFEINANLGSGILVATDFIKSATVLGGGHRDLSAALAGGYSRTSKFYGTSFVTLSVS